MNILLHTFTTKLFIAVSKTYYRRIFINNRHNLPLKGPLILISNHSNAFWDAVLIGIYSPRHIWFLARGDVFKGGIVNKALDSLGIVPIYRKSEGVENMHKNAETFERCYQTLNQGKCIAIYPEGDCFRESTLRPFKKGTARIAFGTLENAPNSNDLQIIAVGINYDKPDNRNSELLISYSEPVKIDEEWSIYKDNPAIAVNQLTGKLYNLLKSVHIHIEDRSQQAVFHFIKNTYFRDFVSVNQNSQSQFVHLKKLADDINLYYKEKSQAYLQLTDDIIQYANELNSMHLQPFQHSDKHGVIKWSSGLIWALFLAPIAAIGYLFHFYPVFQSRYLVKKFVKNEEFITSVKLGTAGFLTFFWYMALLIIMALMSVKAVFILITTGFFIVSGYVWLRFSKIYKSLLNGLKLFQLKQRQPDFYHKLLQKDLSIRKQLEELFFKK